MGEEIFECEQCGWPVIEPYPCMSFLNTDIVFCCDDCRDRWEEIETDRRAERAHERSMQ
jgi:hypothetical protein